MKNIWKEQLILFCQSLYGWQIFEKSNLVPGFLPHFFPKGTKKLSLPIWNYCFMQSMQHNNLSKEENTTIEVVINIMENYKVNPLKKPSHNYKILSRYFIFLGNLKTKSMEISTHSVIGIYKGAYNSWYWTLNYLQTTQSLNIQLHPWTLKVLLQGTQCINYTKMFHKANSTCFPNI